MIVAAEAEVIRRACEMYAPGLSPKHIAARLNTEGIPSHRGGAWGASTIYGNPERGIGIPNNELYIGRRIWNRQRFSQGPQDRQAASQAQRR